MKYSYILHTPSGNLTIVDSVNPFEVSEAKEISIPPYSVKITNQQKKYSMQLKIG